MKVTPIVLLFLIPAFLHGEVYNYYIRIRDFDGSTGYSEVYEIRSIENGHGIRKYIPHTQSATIVFEGKCEAEKIESLGQFLSSIDYSGLQKKYFNPNVFDGYEVFYEITINEAEPRKYWIRNCYHRVFIELSNRVNELLPEEHRMHVPSGNEPYIKLIED